MLRFCLLLVLVQADELSQHADVVALMPQEVESVHSAEPQLQEVVIERLFWNSHELCGVLKRVADGLSVSQLNSIVKLAPERNPFDDKSDLTFFGALEVGFILLSQNVSLFLHLISIRSPPSWELDSQRFCSFFVFSSLFEDVLQIFFFLVEKRLPSLATSVCHFRRGQELLGTLVYICFSYKQV